MGGTCFARRLFESQRRENALRRGVRGKFPGGPCKVFDLRSYDPGMGNGAVHRHFQRVAAPCGGNNALHFVRKQEGVFFGSNHIRKGRLFFGSVLHTATVASAKTA